MATSAVNLFRFFEPHDLHGLATGAPPRRCQLAAPADTAQDSLNAEPSAGTRDKQAGENPNRRGRKPVEKMARLEPKALRVRNGYAVVHVPAASLYEISPFGQ